MVCSVFDRWSVPASTDVTTTLFSLVIIFVTSVLSSLLGLKLILEMILSKSLHVTASQMQIQKSTASQLKSPKGAESYCFRTVCMQDRLSLGIIAAIKIDRASAQRGECKSMDRGTLLLESRVHRVSKAPAMGKDRTPIPKK